MGTNYYGAMRTILAVLPAMREAKSGLINQYQQYVTERVAGLRIAG